MSTDTIDGAGFAAAARSLRGAGELVGDMAEDVVTDIGTVTLGTVKRRRSRHRVTGKGERLITLRTSGDGDGTRARVHAGGKVAHLIAGGTRAHPIRPVRARALRIAGTARGFADAVRHPGTRADPFVARGLDDARGRIADITDTAADELAGDIAHRIGRR